MVKVASLGWAAATIEETDVWARQRSSFGRLVILIQIVRSERHKIWHISPCTTRRLTIAVAAEAVVAVVAVVFYFLPTLFFKKNPL
jgi:hypothetical protein